MKFQNLLCLLYALLITGCSTSKITSTWKAENLPEEPGRRIAVIAIIKDDDRMLRQQMENHLVHDLKALGYDALSSYKLYGPKNFRGLDEEKVLQKLRDDSIDAVLTIVLLSKEKEKHYVPGQIYYSPYGYYYSNFWPYNVALYNRIYQEGYYVTDTSYFWESNLYSMQDQKLIYSVQTQSFDPSTTQRMAHEYGKLIVDDMLKQGVLRTLKK